VARAAEAQDGYSDFGGGRNKAWLRIKAPQIDTAGTGLSDKPGGLVLEAVTNAGVVTTYWLWIDANGMLHSSTSEPTDQDETTTFMGPKNIRTGTVYLNPGTLASRSTIQISTIISGVASGDLVILETPTFTTGVSVTGWIIQNIASIVSTNEIKVKFINVNDTGGSVVIGNEAFKYTWFDLT